MVIAQLQWLLVFHSSSISCIPLLLSVVEQLFLIEHYGRYLHSTDDFSRYVSFLLKASTVFQPQPNVSQLGGKEFS